jgi:gas vesicle protein
MSGTSGFWKGILWGAIAGGTLSLLKKETRQSVLEGCKNASGNISQVMKNPGKVSGQLKTAASKLRSTVEDVVEDLSYIADKVEELKDVTPQVTEIFKETKEAFSKASTLPVVKYEKTVREEPLSEPETVPEALLEDEKTLQV